MKRIIRALTDNPWEGIDMPEGFKADRNPFLNPELSAPSLDMSMVKGSSERYMWWFYDRLNKDDEKYKEPGKTRYLASMADIYKAVKATALGKGNWNERQTILQGLRNDIKHREIITSTRVQYLPGDLEKITNNHGTDRQREDTVQDESIRTRVEKEDYRHLEFSKLVETEEGLRYVQALFGTKDDAATITQVVEAGFGKDACLNFSHTVRDGRDEYGRANAVVTIKYDDAMASKWKVRVTIQSFESVGSVNPKGYAIVAEYGGSK